MFCFFSNTCQISIILAYDVKNTIYKAKKVKERKKPNVFKLIKSSCQISSTNLCDYITEAPAQAMIIKIVLLFLLLLFQPTFYVRT